ncbi:MAG: hypothetical protein WC775_01685 [Patescibacteria group bacterium]|jgi:hypothetical protein
MQFGNVTDSAGTISFTTSQKATVFLKYGTENNLDMVRFDDRDNSAPTARNVHYITLEQLKPNTSYLIVPVINGKEYNDALKPIILRTLAQVNSQSTHPPMFGKILNSKLQPIEDVLITITSKKHQLYAPFTTLSKQGGEWIVTFPLIVDTRTQQITLKEEDIMSVTFRKGGLVSHVTVRYKDAGPMKSVILGSNADFTDPNAVLGENNQTQETQNQLIVFPRNGTSVASQFPVFRGITKPSSLVMVSLNPPSSSAVLMTNSYGEWKLVHKTPLLPGNYTLSVTSKVTGQTQSVAFMIGKSGESVLGDATGSATLTPTVTFAPTATPAISVTQLTPTLLTPTVLPTEAPVFPTPTVVVQRLPSAGSVNTFAIVAASGLSLLGLLLVLY